MIHHHTVHEFFFSLSFFNPFVKSRWSGFVATSCFSPYLHLGFFSRHVQTMQQLLPPPRHHFGNKITRLPWIQVSHSPFSLHDTVWQVETAQLCFQWKYLKLFALSPCSSLTFVPPLRSSLCFWSVKMWESPFPVSPLVSLLQAPLGGQKH